MKNFLLSLIQFNDQAIDVLFNTFKALKLHIYQPKDETLSNYEKLAKTKFNRPQAIKFLINFKELLKCLLLIDDQNVAKKCYSIFEQGLILISICCSSNPTITESDWLHVAKIFASNWKKMSLVQTTYLHVFVYHVGYFLEKYSGLEKYANYSIEGIVHYTKKNISSSTNHFGGWSSKNDEFNCFKQLLEKNFREQPAFKSALPMYENPKQWSCTISSDSPNNIVEFFDNNKF